MTPFMIPQAVRRQRSLSSRAALLLGVVLLAGGCSESSTSPAALIPEDGELGLGVDGQLGTVATALPTPLSIVVRDSAGRPLAGVPIVWQANSGQGSISPATSQTGVDGVSTAVWTLGEKAGRQEARAIVATRDTIRIIAFAQASPVVAKLDIAAPSVDLPLGVGRAVALAIDLRDRFDNPLTTRTPVWRTLDASVASVSELGVVVARTSGSARVVATLDAVADTLTLVVGATQPRRWQQVAVGVSHTCAVTASGELFCWGFNRNGQIGDGTILHRTLPVRVPMPTGVNIAHVRAAGSSTCVLDDRGRIWCWGLARDGSVITVPTLLDASGRVFTDFAITAGVGSGAGSGPNGCALTADGAAFCWGSGGAGQLGNGATTSSGTPVAVTMPDGVRFVELAMGGASVCARSGVGEAWCWGSLAASPSAANGRLSPGRIVLPAEVRLSRLSAGDAHVCATSESGSAWCWGRNTRGQLGVGTPATTYTAVAVAAPAGTLFRTVQAHGLTTCAILRNGGLSCMGAGTAGEQGNGVFLDRNAQGLVSIPGELRFAQLAGGAHVCALTEGGDLFCWGAGTWGGLGVGDYVNYALARKVRNP